MGAKHGLFHPRVLLCFLWSVQVPHGGYGDDQNLRFLIMSRLGPDVDAARAKTGPWPLPRQAGYGRQMLSLLRTLHERCKMVFVDVKPGGSRRPGVYGLRVGSTTARNGLPLPCYYRGVDFGADCQCTCASGTCGGSVTVLLYLIMSVTYNPKFCTVFF